MNHYHCYAPYDENAGELLARPGAKTLHLIRHAEAIHQVKAASEKRKGNLCRCHEASKEKGSDLKNKSCPYMDATLIDSSLTKNGLTQSEGIAASCGAEVVFTSPMFRSLQTVLAAFPASKLNVLAYEELRPRISAHMHSQRRSRSCLKARFPRVDFSNITHDRDDLWSTQKESRESLDKRIEVFLQVLNSREEKNVAVVTHFSILLGLFNASTDETFLGVNPARSSTDLRWFDCRNGPHGDELQQWLQPGELRSFLIVPA